MTPQPPRAAAPAAASGHGGGPPHPGRQDRLGPYRLIEPVAEGALTVTWRAEHVELGRRVLIRCLAPGLPASSPFAESLEREAKILARLQHSAVLALLELARTPDATYLVVEDPGGPSLDRLIQAGRRLPAEVATAVGLEIARALGHAHERGVVHRDLRPENVHLTPEGAVKVGGFAVAHDARLPSLPEPFEAASYARPDYMAPEQILGADAEASSDVFALGVVIYELVCGARPFSGSERGETGHRIRTADPGSLRALVADVPRALEQTVLRCLAKAPEDRYEDGRAAGVALEAALAEQTHAPTRVLVSRALAGAGLGPEHVAPSPGAASGPRIGTRPAPVLPTAAALAAVLGLILAGGAVIELVVRDDVASGDAGSSPFADDAPVGQVRVLARPWAEVFVDGELVDVTPIGRPIPLAPGKHFFTFKHPNAPDEKRTVRVGSGQTVVIDVTMLVDRPAKDAGPPGPDAGGSP